MSYEVHLVSLEPQQTIAIRGEALVSELSRTFADRWLALAGLLGVRGRVGGGSAGRGLSLDGGVLVRPGSRDSGQPSAEGSRTDTGIESGRRGNGTHHPSRSI